MSHVTDVIVTVLSRGGIKDDAKICNPKLPLFYTYENTLKAITYMLVTFTQLNRGLTQNSLASTKSLFMYLRPASKC